MHTGSYTTPRVRPPAVPGAFLTGDAQVLPQAAARLVDGLPAVAGPLNQWSRVAEIPAVRPGRRVE